MKRSTILAAMTIAAMSFAQSTAPDRLAMTHGDGVAQSADGRVAKVNFEAVKVKANGAEVVRGNLKFQQVANSAGRLVHVGIKMVSALGVTDNKAEFAGAGVLETQREGRAVRLEGKVVVNVIDNRKPTDAATAQKDGFRLRFKANNSDVTFEFTGVIREGDLVVWKKPATTN